MEKVKTIEPHNNKAIFHSLGMAMQMLIDNELSVEKAREVANMAGKMQKSLFYELDRIRVIDKVGSEKFGIEEPKFRDIEKQF